MAIIEFIGIVCVVTLSICIIIVLLYEYFIETIGFILIIIWIFFLVIGIQAIHKLMFY